MKKLITIILALIMTIFTVPNRGADQPPVIAPETPQVAVVTQVEQVPEEETVECIDEGDQSLAEYKPQIGDQPNPFENDAPTEIDDRPVEDYVGEGEDRPGEGKHF
jgi:hypothetical protein